MHQDHEPYYKFTTRSIMDKSINSLLGIIEGISIDSNINLDEINFLTLWLAEHRDFQTKHPFNELMPVISTAIADGLLTEEEKQDIIWLCDRLRSSDYYDQITGDLQRLHAILGGIIADTKITINELEGLSDWLQNHAHLRTCWPYDEVDSLITTVLADHKIDEVEHKMLMSFFSEFITILDDRTICNPLSIENISMTGICAVCPDIKIEGSIFCFTGASSKYTRTSFVDIVQQLGGTALGAVSKKVNYLIIGSEGNPCWSYSCYGRKVEKAVQLRKQGLPILIVHENDFHAAVADS